MELILILVTNTDVGLFAEKDDAQLK